MIWQCRNKDCNGDSMVLVLQLMKMNERPYLPSGMTLDRFKEIVLEKVKDGWRVVETGMRCACGKPKLEARALKAGKIIEVNFETYQQFFTHCGGRQFRIPDWMKDKIDKGGSRGWTSLTDNSTELFLWYCENVKGMGRPVISDVPAEAASAPQENFIDTEAS